MIPQHIGAFVIVVKDNRVLLGKRKNCYKAGMFGCPGGRLELKEPLEECAKRELFEETGLIASTLRYLGVIRELQDGHNFIHFGFVCDAYEGQLTLKEPDKCEEWIFFTHNNLPADILSAHLAGIKKLQNKQSNTFVEILE